MDFAESGTRKTSVLFPDDDEIYDPVRPHHGGPLKLDIKSIPNVTRADVADDINSVAVGEESGRSLLTAAVLVSWIFVWKWKAYITFFIVHTLDFIWTSVKNLLGWGNDHYETTITWGGHDDHHHGWGHNNHHHGHHTGHHHHGHQHHHPGHQGWPAQHHHHRPKWVHRPSGWHHPATKLFEHPTYQYLPHGQEYTLMGFDQHQALKYNNKYKRKFDRYRRKYYRKKYKQKLKAQRQRERQKKKAARRREQAAKRKENWEVFKERVKEVKKFYDTLSGNPVDADDDDENDDLKGPSGTTSEKKEDKDKENDDLKTKGDKKKKDDGKKEPKDEDEEPLSEEEKDSEESKESDEEDDLAADKDKIDNLDKLEDLDVGKDEIDVDGNDKVEPKEDRDEVNDKKGSKEKDVDFKDEVLDDLPLDDALDAADDIGIGHEKPPRKTISPHYKPGHDYDPLPTITKDQKFIRIRL